MARTTSRSNRKKEAQWKFPVSLRILVPDGGYGRDYAKMHEWLRSRYGLDGFAWMSDSIPGFRDASLIFFPDAEGPAAFMQRFPAVEFAANSDV